MTHIDQKQDPESAPKFIRGSDNMQARAQILNESQLLQPINERKKAALEAQKL